MRGIQSSWLGLFDEADDRKNKNEGHCHLRCNAKRTIGFDEGDLDKDQIDGEQEASERDAEEEHGAVLFKEAGLAFEP